MVLYFVGWEMTRTLRCYLIRREPGVALGAWSGSHRPATYSALNAAIAAWPMLMPPSFGGIDA